MAIRPPSLDDRRFDDLVEELVARIPAHTPEWTHPAPGDPGRTLIELFAWLGDALLYRVNLVPERQRLAFLRLVGAELRPAVPARGILTLGFRDPQTTAVQVLRPGAAVSGPAPFETCAEVTVLPVQGEAYVKRLLSDEERAAVHDLLPGLVQLYGISGTPVPYATAAAFAGGAPARESLDLATTADASLWIALLAATAGQVDAVRHAIGSQAISVGVKPTAEVPDRFEEIGPRGRVPHVWEVTTGSDDAAIPPLVAIDEPEDSTAGLRRQGVQRLLLPRADLLGAPSNDVRQSLAAGVGDLPPRIDDAKKAARIVTWLRLRPTVEMQSFALAWTGVNAVEIEQRQMLPPRIVGESDGTPGQQMSLQGRSVDPATLLVQVEEPDAGFRPWRRFDDLAVAGRDDTVFSLDAEAGLIRFGDGVRGRIPEAGRRVRAAIVRAGGGAAGNLPPGALAAVRGIDAAGQPAGDALTVGQPLPTWGGEDPETLEAAEQRIPALFRHRDRAVTPDDYRRLAAETPGAALGRIEVLPRFKPQQRRADVPGVVSVMVLPDKAPVGPPNPRADRPLLEAVFDHLDARRPVATELYVIGCEYVPIAASIGVSVLDGVSRETVLTQVRDAVRRFLWPLAGGGTDGTGWRLGRGVRERDLEVAAARVAGVDEVLGVNLFARRDRRWAPVPRAAGAAESVVSLEAWQLPELLDLLVVTDDEPPARLEDGDRRGAAGAHAVPVPVVPEVC